MLYGIVAATSALLLTAVLAVLLRAPALRLGLLDRRHRQRRVPLSGGAAVVLATCLVVAAGEWTGYAPLRDGMGVLLAAAAGVAALGLAADLWRLKTRLLALGTAIAAAFVVPYGDTGAAEGAVAVCWIACVSLAFRALDHADGVAGTVGVVTAFGVGACVAAEMMDGLAVLLSVLAAALTGFLMHNWPPARVALGGCGSLFAGFVLAAAAVSARAGQEAATGAAVLFALTAVAVADAALVLLARRVAGRPLTRGGRDHLAHRLRRLGLTPQGVTIVIGAAAFAGVLVGVLVHSGWADAHAVLWVAGVTSLVVLGLWRVPVYGRAGEGRWAEGRAPEGRPAECRPVDGRALVGRPVDGGRRRAGEAGARRAGQGVVRRTEDADVRRADEVGARRGEAPGRGGQRPRRQPVSAVSPPRSSGETVVRAARRLDSSQVSGPLRVRNG
ncbi:MraY family glycosyltransferase [Streptomyces sp. BK239]|uniref:MraY family glycosyltransferase n=1 Tax=Streptomyces sp. BK239 TaxID=2512155 RepID=UPI00102BED01|nr:MraY family glycosyltransferase [Streptomyces sp. BK239]RZU21709.1 UDP-GlcNAc:undecaprenyl-phosphate GlcNAc-1-phosphate transferase [Streptomyces sp. BK239]